MVETSVPVKEAIFSRNDIVISVDELDGAISKLDRNKACCYDQIYAELLQLFSKGVAETGVGWHTFPMQLHWKKCVSQPRSPLLVLLSL